MSWPKGKSRPIGKPSPPNRSSKRKLTTKGKQLKNKINNKYIEITSNFKEWSDKYYKEQLLKLDIDEISAIEHYVSGETLRENIQLGYLSTYQKALVQNLDSAIDKCKIPHNMKLYRGTSLEYYKDFEKGSVFVDRGFVSTSIDKSYAKKWAKEAIEYYDKKAIFMEVRVRRGQKGIYVGNHPWDFDKWFKEGGDESQREMILPRDKIFKVLEKTSNSMIVEML